MRFSHFRLTLAQPPAEAAINLWRGEHGRGAGTVAKGERRGGRRSNRDRDWRMSKGQYRSAASELLRKQTRNKYRMKEVLNGTWQ
eukprot:5182314-Alexandrium_andersonii.AAC.1